MKKGAKGKKVKVKKPAPEVDTLVIGNLVLSGDSSSPQLFATKFGQLPKVFSSDRGVPTPLGGTPPRNPNLTGLCEIVAAPPGLGFNYLVRFFGSPGNLAVTIRTKGVEQVICPTSGSDAATLTSLGKRGAGPVADDDRRLHSPEGLEAGGLRQVAKKSGSRASERPPVRPAAAHRCRLGLAPLRLPSAEGFLTVFDATCAFLTSKSHPGMGHVDARSRGV